MVPKIFFVEQSGVEHAVDARLGDSVMQAATMNGVPGIVGECGGNASCGTCHVWVRDAHWDQVGPPVDDLEEDLLDMGVTDRRVESRLSCQVQVTDELDGLTLDIPPDQP